MSPHEAIKPSKITSALQFKFCALSRPSLFSATVAASSGSKRLQTRVASPSAASLSVHEAEEGERRADRRKEEEGRGEGKAKSEV